MTGRALRLGLSICGLFMVMSAIAVGKKTSPDANRSKARHYYLQGAVKEASEEYASAYEYYKKAYVTDTSYEEAAFAYGFARMMLMEDIFASRNERLRNLKLMRAYIDKYPDDRIAGEDYAYYAGVADTIPEAIRIYEKLTEAYPGKSSLYIPQSFFYMQMGETEKAVKAMEEYERLTSSSPESTVRKFSIRFSSGDTIGAINEIRKFAAENPDNGETKISLAVVYNMLGFKDSALMVIDDLMTNFKGPITAEIKFEAGRIYAENGDSVHFQRLAAEAIKSEDNDYNGRMDMLRSYLEMIPQGAGNYEESDQLFEYLESKYGAEASFYEIYGDYELRKGNIEESFRKMQKVNEMEPDNPYSLGRLVSLSVLANKPQEGMKAFETFLANGGHSNYNLDLVYITAAQNAEDFPKALVWTDTLLQNIIPSLSIADSITPSLRVELLKDFSELDLFAASTAYEVAGDLFSLQNNIDEAMRSYENAIVISDSLNSSSLNNFAYYLVDKVKDVVPGTPLFAKAKALSRKSLEIESKEPNGNYYDTYAWILFKEQNYEDALTYQEVCMELEGENAPAEMFSHYGDILFMLGRPEDALRQWEKGLEKEPGDALLKKKVEHKTFFYE